MDLPQSPVSAQTFLADRAAHIAGLRRQSTIESISLIALDDLPQAALAAEHELAAVGGEIDLIQLLSGMIQMPEYTRLERLLHCERHNEGPAFLQKFLKQSATLLALHKYVAGLRLERVKGAALPNRNEASQMTFLGDSLIDVFGQIEVTRDHRLRFAEVSFKANEQAIGMIEDAFQESLKKGNEYAQQGDKERGREELVRLMLHMGHAIRNCDRLLEHYNAVNDTDNSSLQSQQDLHAARNQLYSRTVDVSYIRQAIEQAEASTRRAAYELARSKSIIVR
jgi:hypothetical protein